MIGPDMTLGRVLACAGSVLVAAWLANGCDARTELVVARGAAGAGAAGTSTGGASGTDAGMAARDGGDDTLPLGWEGAEALMIRQLPCGLDGASFPPPVVVTDGGSSINVEIACVELRELQALCGYASESGARTRVLIQPCDLHPTSVPKGDSSYDVRFTLAARRDLTTLEVYERGDFYGATPPNAPKLIATAAVGPPNADGGSDATDGGPAAHHGCAPAFSNTSECGGTTCTTAHACCPGFGSDCGVQIRSPDSGVGGTSCTTDESCTDAEYCQDSGTCCPLGSVCPMQ